MVQEAGGLSELEKFFTSIEEKTPEGQAKIRETWGMTPEAVEGMAAAEAMFGPGG